MSSRRIITVALVIALVLVGVFSYGIINTYSEKKLAAETKDSTENIKQAKLVMETKMVSKVAKSAIEIKKSNNEEDKKIRKHLKKKSKKIKKAKKAKLAKKAKKTKKTKKSKLKSLGTFKLTAYCGCSSCCGGQGAYTASGAKPTVGRTIAVDTSVIPFGTHVYINGHEYVAEDRGGAINGNRIDVFFGDHSSATDFGVQYAEVFVKE